MWTGLKPWIPWEDWKGITSLLNRQDKFCQPLVTQTVTADKSWSLVLFISFNSCMIWLWSLAQCAIDKVQRMRLFILLYSVHKKSLYSRSIVTILYLKGPKMFSNFRCRILCDDFRITFLTLCTTKEISTFFHCIFKAKMVADKNSSHIYI